MTTSKVFLFVLAASFGLATIFSACKTDEPTNIPVKVTNVSLNKTTLLLVVGTSEQLKASITPDNATDKSITWTSENSNLATVNANGNVTAVAIGETTITVTTKDGQKMARCKVTVAANSIPATSIALDKTTLELVVGGTFILMATVLPENSTDNITWTSGNTNVATVENGNVTAKTVGTATITATAGSKTATCTVNVAAKEIHATSIALDSPELNLSVGDSHILRATVLPENSTDNITWTSGNTNVATVENGNVTAKTVGTATITATAGSKTATCTVNVAAKEIHATSITLDSPELNLSVGDSHILIATVLPENATDNITWASNNTNVATVENGNVTAKTVGTATITATAGSKTATCTVNVAAKEIHATSIALDSPELNLSVGDSHILIATVLPENATDNITWASNNTNVATVENGNVTAKTVGTATITATAGNKTATCTVNVAAQEIHATSIVLNKTTLELVVGGTFTLMATVLPENSTDNITWASSNTNVATVENGNVTAKTVGTATITATAGSKTATCTVTVIPVNLRNEIAFSHPAGSTVISYIYSGGIPTGFTFSWSMSVGNYSGVLPLTFNFNGKTLNKTMTVQANTSYGITIYGTLSYDGRSFTFPVSISSETYLLRQETQVFPGQITEIH